ncbi:MAG: DNA invertase Pin [Candidatus Hinthialibacteria bacterium]
MKAVGYIRVSTTDQAQEGVSLEAQRAKVEAWCLANGAELVAVHVDAGISGKRADNRPALQEALSQVAREKGALVVYSLSRLARSTKDAIGISERIDKAGADLVSLTERIDTTTAAGKMVFRMLAVLAEFERDLISERTATAMGQLKAKGRLVGKVPYGYDLAQDGETLVANLREQKGIARIKALRDQGLSLRKIGAALDVEGFGTKEGGPWTAAALKRILDRPTMPGEAAA